MRISICQYNPTVGAISKNKEAIINHILEAKREGADLVIFPELALTGYPPEDLLLDLEFLNQAEQALLDCVKVSSGIAVLVGCIRPTLKEGAKPLYNSCAVIENGVLVGFQDKALLPTYDVFDERRYFEPAKDEKIWTVAQKRVGITICEDIWAFSGEGEVPSYDHDPLCFFEQNHVDVLVNLSASPYAQGKNIKRRHVCERAAKKSGAYFVMCNQVGANDALLFDGRSSVFSESGKLLLEMAAFQEERVTFELESLKPIEKKEQAVEEELFSALTMGLKDYFQKQGFQKALVGLSGGIDSALVASIATAALGKEHVVGVLLPSRFTSCESTEDALYVAKNLGIATYEIPIEKIFQSTIDTLHPIFDNKPFDVTEENMQSRVRSLLLMALSNKSGALVLNTSNKSEFAVGYSTLYGDTAGAISVIGDLFKTEVYAVATWIMHHFGWIPPRVITKAPSAELKGNQKDSDTLPEYHILDPILEDLIVHRLSPVEISKRRNVQMQLVEEIIRKIYKNEFKRRQCPFALRVSEKAFSVGRRVPIVQRFFS